MQIRFQLPLALRITLASRKAANARKAFDAARLNREIAETEANLPEGQRPPFSALTFLAALCVESDARRAKWAAEDALAYLTALAASASIPSGFRTHAR